VWTETSMHKRADQYVDAARGTMNAAELVALERHAMQCEQCANELRFWRRVVGMLDRDVAYDPPSWVVATARASFVAPRRVDSPVAAGRRRLRTLLAHLTFDTFHEAIPVGVRAAGTGTRQLVYAAGPLSIDLRLESSRQRWIVVTGQIASTDEPIDRGEGAGVTVVGADHAIAGTAANQFGEFACEFERADGLKLVVVLKDGTEIGIPLDRLPVTA
jgi:hypothetical protein